MKDKEGNKSIPPFMRGLCPKLSEDELQDATNQLARLVALCIEIQTEHFDAIEKYEQEQSLTEKPLNDRMNG